MFQHVTVKTASGSRYLFRYHGTRCYVTRIGEYTNFAPLLNDPCIVTRFKGIGHIMEIRRNSDDHTIVSTNVTGLSVTTFFDDGHESYDESPDFSPWRTGTKPAEELALDCDNCGTMVPLVTNPWYLPLLLCANCNGGTPIN